ncbi:MAG: hypothetical protein LBD01_04895 [Puniceicoccales bacterium]|jgi:hypothetical protein|nr:hypothetical protein [Puniceicoccales bacterium]
MNKTDTLTDTPPPTPCLFLDASGQLPVVGVWGGVAWQAFRQGTASTAETLFALVKEVLEEAGQMRLHNCAGFIFVEGPGSVLGISIVAMALRTWRALPECAVKPLFSAGTFSLAAHLLLRAHPREHAFSLLADSRQGWWNTARVRRAAELPAVVEMRDSELSILPQPRFLLSQRTPSKVPVDCQPFPKTLLEQDPAVLHTQGLLRRTDVPDAVNPPAQYTKWLPQRHCGTLAKSPGK